VATLRGHTAKPDGMNFGPDGQTLATTGGTETILWSVPQRVAMVTIHGSSGPPSFSPDGHLLATWSTNSSDASVITLWDTDPSSWQRELCAMAGRDLTETEWHSYLPDRPYQPSCR
jgi:WD40 repeat protein